MYRCPACDQPNHGTDKCTAPGALYCPKGHLTPVKEVDKENTKPVDNRKFIGSGEDVQVWI